MGEPCCLRGYGRGWWAAAPRSSVFAPFPWGSRLGCRENTLFHNPCPWRLTKFRHEGGRWLWAGQGRRGASYRCRWGKDVAVVGGKGLPGSRAELLTWLHHFREDTQHVAYASHPEENSSNEL